MNAMKRSMATLVLLLACALTIPPATANARTNVTSTLASDTELEEIDRELQTIFKRYLLPDEYGFLQVNVQAVTEDGKSASEYQQIADGLNRNPYLRDRRDKGALTSEHACGSGSWARCAINFVVPASLFEGFMSGIRAWLEQGRYAEVIGKLIRIVGPAAIKGGLQGAVAALAAGAAWCATPWAS